MSLLVTSTSLRERAKVVGASGPLAPLAASLLAELEPVASREPYLPREKALLSRAGGRCPLDAVNLEFDPLSPHAHRCPVCAHVYEGELHDRFWIFWYQLWLAERAVHGAALAALGVAPGVAEFTARVLQAYVDAYGQYLNRDNVLGPTRLFFSTYLESIWLLNLCIATDLLELHDARYTALADHVREQIVEPSRAIIASYDEGASNRQVWNNAALLAAARLLRDDAAAERVVQARSGLVYHLRNGLLEDGTWYEGENYHLFAHRGLWYGVTMAEVAGIELPGNLLTRFQEGFATPFLTALPDLTLPSRRDSQYAISLRQWRFAELCELGLGRIAPRVDERLVYALQRLYEDPMPRGDTGRARSTADVERNLAPTALSRADLGWRCLFYARRDLPPLDAQPPRSVLLEAQGLAVLRRESGRVYVALDYGASGGGHGHPDRLDLLLYDGNTRWLDDMGTGSYVDPSLHWYRSTLAHNAPLFGERSQARVDGQLLAFQELDDIGWVSALAADLAPGVTAVRTIVVTPEYLVDELTWRGPAREALDLPFHLNPDAVHIETESGDARSPQWMPAPLTGSEGLEDGFRFVGHSECFGLGAGARLELTVQRGGRTLRGWTWTSRPARWFRAAGPGAPGAGESLFVLWRVDPHRVSESAKEAEGTIRSVFAWSEAVLGARLDEGVEITLADGRRQVHSRAGGGWRVETRHGGGTHTVVLRGAVPRESSEREAEISAPRNDTIHSLSEAQPLVLELAERSYRRSEETWREAGAPSARLQIAWKPPRLLLELEVWKEGALTFAPANAENAYDNEHPDVNGDGVQLYLDTDGGASAWMLVPDPALGNDRVRLRPIDGWLAPRAIDARWSPTGTGYRMTIDLDLADITDGQTIGLDLIVNEKPSGRGRRRGQLVLSGAEGEHVYLRGDRHEPERLLRLGLGSQNKRRRREDGKEA